MTDPQDRIILIRKEWYLPNKVIKFNTSYSGYNSTPIRQYEEALTKVKGYFDGK
jgi:hypothetical protein